MGKPKKYASIDDYDKNDCNMRDVQPIDFVKVPVPKEHRFAGKYVDKDLIEDLKIKLSMEINKKKAFYYGAKRKMGKKRGRPKKTKE